MKLFCIFLLSALVVRATPAVDPLPATAPAYFAKWAMVKMWPQPQQPLTEAEVADVQQGKRTQAYTVVHHNPAGQLWTLEEIADGKRKVKFAYVYDDAGQVIRIDLFLSDGQTKTYYDRYGKPPPKK